jgi:hypothetical protein
MGTIKQGILGEFSGKVGTVIGGSWKGIDYMRAQAQNVHNPKTEGQMSQRSKFAQTFELLKPITAYVRVGFKTYASKQTVFNAAMSYNVKNAFSGTYPNFVFEPSQALVSRGTLEGASGCALTVGVGTMSITHRTVAKGNGQATDRTMPLVFNIDKGEAVFSTNASACEDGSVSLSIPADWADDSCHVYLRFISEDGKEVANSVYVGQITAQ